MGRTRGKSLNSTLRTLLQRLRYRTSDSPDWGVRRYWDISMEARPGRKCAIIAVAHSILVIGYHLQRKRCTYTDLGGNYFDRLHAEGLKRYLVKRLESLGHSVTLQPRIA
jgi:hypothetical protein